MNWLEPHLVRFGLSKLGIWNGDRGDFWGRSEAGWSGRSLRTLLGHFRRLENWGWILMTGKYVSSRALVG